MKHLRFLFMLAVWAITASPVWEWFMGTMEPRKRWPANAADDGSKIYGPTGGRGAYNDRVTRGGKDEPREDKPCNYPAAVPLPKTVPIGMLDSARLVDTRGW